MARLWAKIIVNHRIAHQATATYIPSEPEETLVELCKEFDIPSPIWLRKHHNEFQEFGHTAFLPDHFIEEVPFDKLEIEFLDDTEKKRRSKDPRNQFDGF